MFGGWLLGMIVSLKVFDGFDVGIFWFNVFDVYEMLRLVLKDVVWLKILFSRR